MGKFRHKCCEVGTQVKQTKPYTPWSNVEDGPIWKLKCRTGWKMAKSSCPAKLWDQYLELEAYIRSHSALDKYKLQGQVPETIMSGQTADISPFIEHPFYAWVKFLDDLAKYPEPKEQLGRWLGHAIDIGPAMTAQILKSNRQVLYMLTYHGLTDEEHMIMLKYRNRSSSTPYQVQVRLSMKITNMFPTLMMTSIWKQGTHTLELMFHYLMGILNRLAKLFARPGIRMVN